MFKYLRIPAAIALASILSLSACGGESTDKTTDTKATADTVKTAAVFYCPMKCEGEKTHAQAGSCSVCGMDLVAAE